ncbi:LacI family DNA-binding transcriptional regulator [Novosphingobium sp. 1949]|uniref:LacI family DNA-binding transcriptional regulator n=1 Tax=Novosphingobium organovorum TaxID=2930092 RepID=A0ABT0BIY5_9SPHN|nr:LacI family DNA-binding transcriptional regulator [Novosphingobium organovorum]MCJ2184786.1 LacI family DNA-binding transcriptional regulator [Novosphingobium organovorum]
MHSVIEKPTGSDVARLAGVSKSAVSRAFTGGVVSEEARKRILEAARLLKYRPSNTARSLTTRQSRMIGLAVTSLDNQFYPEVVEKLSDRFARAGYRLLLFVTHGEADLDPVLNELLGYGLDGVVLASSSMASQVAAECREAGVPVVMFNNVDPDGVQAGVSSDDEAGAALVARYLLASGHERPAVITGLGQSSSSVRRLRGFQYELARAGRARARASSGDYTFSGAFEVARAWIEGPSPPDALFCVNDHMAIGALHAVHHRGLTPGRDISVIGFDNVSIAHWPLLDLTTLAQPLEGMIEATVALLLKAIASNTMPTTQEALTGKLVIRGSARRAPGITREASGEETWAD